jgi:MFS family permease
VSLVGDGVWLVAVAWQVIELGGGPVQLSLVTSAFAVGLIAFMLIGGVVADRVSRRRIMLLADAARAAVVVLVGVLSVTDALEVWQLAVAALVVGTAEAFFVPAFAGLVPELLPETDVLAANGLEGVVRPLAQRAAGPALGGVLVAAAGAGPAILLNAGTYAVSAACLAAMSPAPPRTRDAVAGVRGALTDLADGARYVRSERWLWGTLVFALVAVLFLLGPIEVLVPFVIRDQIGSDAGGYGLFLAVYGVASALGALAISSWGVPRRYLTAMLLLWGAGSLPLAAFGELHALWLVCLGGFVVAATSGAAGVVWGTLLQRRVRNELRGRVSSLDWFVSLALMPVSMALAGPAAELLGRSAVFVAAGVAPAVVGLVVLYGLRLPRDELAHPLAR